MSRSRPLISLEEPMTGHDYRDRVAAFVAANYARFDVEVYTEVYVGQSIIGKDRRIDVLAIRGPQALAIECKFQSSRGTTDEKIHYALADLDALWIPGVVAYAGTGWSRGVMHALAAARRAAFCLPRADLVPTADTSELDHVFAATFGLWRDVLPDSRRFPRS